MPKLVVFRGDAVEHELRLAGQSVRIGRDQGNDLVLDDSSKGVSRFHAEVRAEAGNYFIVDAKSRNGVWIDGRRIKDKAALVLGVPATVGPYELVLEDDVPTGDFGEMALPHPAGHTAPVDRSKQQSNQPSSRSSRSGTLAGTGSPAPAPRRQYPKWSLGALALLVIGGAALGFLLIRPRQATVPDDPPPTPPAAAALVGPRALEDPRKKAIQARLAEAQTAINDGDYRTALRDHVLPVLDVIAELVLAGAGADFDAENQQALELKKQAEARRPPAPVVVDASPPPQLPDCERSGIPKRPNESCTEYNARASGLIVNFQEGSRYLDIPDYANALARFRLVDSAQKGYRNVDALIAEATEKQRRALEIAINGGQQNEQAGNLRDARTWYQQAMAIDPGSATARDRHAAVLNRMNAEASKLFVTASTNKKLQNREAARKQFQQIVDTMLPADDIRIKAEQELEGLKR